jgi:hypothetical protein
VRRESAAPLCKRARRRRSSRARGPERACVGVHRATRALASGAGSRRSQSATGTCAAPPCCSGRSWGRIVPYSRGNTPHSIAEPPSATRHDACEAAAPEHTWPCRRQPYPPLLGAAVWLALGSKCHARTRRCCVTSTRTALTHQCSVDAQTARSQAGTRTPHSARSQHSNPTHTHAHTHAHTHTNTRTHTHAHTHQCTRQHRHRCHEAA